MTPRSLIFSATLITIQWFGDGVNFVLVLTRMLSSIGSNGSKHNLKKYLKQLRRPFAPIGCGLLMASGMVFAPIAAVAGDWNQFDVCVSELKRNGVSDDAAASGCAQAIIPKEMSQCVNMISRNTNITGIVALQSCFQVRRPVDLGNCVVDIDRGVVGRNRSPEGEDVTMAALNSCRQSLLPGRHSECVLALSREVSDFTPQKAMNTCLAAEDFPRDLFPAYSETQPN
ncbi:hypothetical protein H6G45_01025 [Synechocystis sp. FACHB-383]|nr:hypothetical protein [Synechocystis sp. FACHB-383]